MGLLEQRFREEMAKSKNSAKMEEGVADVLYPTRFLPFDYANGYIVEVLLPNGQSYCYNNIGIVDGSANTLVLVKHLLLYKLQQISFVHFQMR